MEPLEKTYVASKKKWSEFELHPELIEVLKIQNMLKPTRVQQETLAITTNADRKKFSLLVRSSNGSGKTLCYLLPILNSLKQGVVTAKDRKMGSKTLKNEVFMPQAIIFVQTGLLLQQIELVLNDFKKNAEKNAEANNSKPQLLNFTVGTMTGDKHTHGDIVISVVKSFLNRFERKNVTFENCNFVALDEIDEIFDSGEQSLQKLLGLIAAEPKTKTIVCSATMRKEFLQFYSQNVPNSLEVNINQLLKKEIGHSISLEGVSNYVSVVESKEAMFSHILNDVFRQLYQNTDKVKPKVFIFFNSVSEIEKFKRLFDELASDVTNEAHKYLEGLSVNVLAAHRKIDGKDIDLTHQERGDILTKFRNGDIRVLLATNIIARGIDIRDVCFVINFDVAKDRQAGEISIDTYLHRVGRTGRYSDRGVALTVVANPADKKKLVDSVGRVHKVDIKDVESVESLHKEILQCINFNANIEAPIEAPMEEKKE